MFGLVLVFGFGVGIEGVGVGVGLGWRGRVEGMEGLMYARCGAGCVLTDFTRERER